LSGEEEEGEEEEDWWLLDQVATSSHLVIRLIFLLNIILTFYLADDTAVLGKA
jgi:hypothetical protein